LINKIGKYLDLFGSLKVGRASWSVKGDSFLGAKKKKAFLD